MTVTCQATTGKYTKPELTQEEKMAILNDYSKQNRMALKTGYILCNACEQERPLIRAYKCYFCSRWYCPACAYHHFT